MNSVIKGLHRLHRIANKNVLLFVFKTPFKASSPTKQTSPDSAL